MKYAHTNWFVPPSLCNFSKEEKEIVIGDVHGQYDSLSTLLQGIGNSCETREYNLTFLGDIIDRGPRNFDCLKLASEVKKDYTSVTRLLGNHELMMFYSVLDILSPREKKSNYELWTMNGGSTVVDEIFDFLKDANYNKNSGTLLYGFEGILGEEAWNDLYESFLPYENRHHKGTHKRVGNLLFTHAGVDPYRKNLEDYFSESGSDFWRNHWAWIRDDFLHYDGNLPEDVFVIHGHTPTYAFLN
jgi:serine/threonine protein phosphatase 1